MQSQIMVIDAKMPEENKVYISVRLSKEQHKKLKKYCVEHDITINDLFRKFVDQLPEDEK